MLRVSSHKVYWRRRPPSVRYRTYAGLHSKRQGRCALANSVCAGLATADRVPGSVSADGGEALVYLFEERCVRSLLHRDGERYLEEHATRDIHLARIELVRDAAADMRVERGRIGLAFNKLREALFIARAAQHLDLRRVLLDVGRQRPGARGDDGLAGQRRQLVRRFVGRAHIERAARA